MELLMSEVGHLKTAEQKHNDVQKQSQIQIDGLKSSLSADDKPWLNCIVHFDRWINEHCYSWGVKGAK